MGETGSGGAGGVGTRSASDALPEEARGPKRRPITRHLWKGLAFLALVAVLSAAVWAWRVDRAYVRAVRAYDAALRHGDHITDDIFEETYQTCSEDRRAGWYSAVRLPRLVDAVFNEATAKLEEKNMRVPGWRRAAHRRLKDAHTELVAAQRELRETGVAFTPDEMIPFHEDQSAILRRAYGASPADRALAAEQLRALDDELAALSERAKEPKARFRRAYEGYVAAVTAIVGRPGRGRAKQAGK